MTSLSLLLLLFVVAFVLSPVSGFQTAQKTTRCSFCTQRKVYNKFPSHSPVNTLRAQVGSDEGDTTPSGDSYEGEIDWDAEWKKVVEQKGQNIDRPGKDFYKNDAQKAAAKATRVASEQIRKIKVVQPDINMRMLTGDAKFWIGICKYKYCMHYTLEKDILSSLCPSHFSQIVEHCVHHISHKLLNLVICCTHICADSGDHQCWACSSNCT